MRWILGAIVILVIGTVFRLGLLVYAMYVLLGVLLISRFLARSWIQSVSAERECSRFNANIGEKVAFVISVRNDGTLPVPWVLVEDVLPRRSTRQPNPAVKVHGKRLKLAQLGPNGEQPMLYQLTFLRRGYYQIGPIVLETGDLFGLHRRYKTAAEPHFIIVYPKVVPLIGYNIASRRPVGEVRITHRLFEDPTRISGVRQYEIGDPLKRVHWRATARMGELQSKTYEPSTVAGATFLLDFNSESFPDRSEPWRSDLAITSVASIASAVVQLGEQIGFVSNGRDAADRIREEGWGREFDTREQAQTDVVMAESSDRLRPVRLPTRRGGDQMSRLLEILARLEFTTGLSFGQMVVESMSRMPRDASVVAVLGDVSDETAISLGNLRRSGYAVTAILIMPVEENQTGRFGRFGERSFHDDVGRLLAEGVEVRQLENEEQLSTLASGMLV